MHPGVRPESHAFGSPAVEDARCNPFNPLDMKIRLFFAIVGLSLLGVVIAWPLHAYEALQGPTELLHWDTTNAWSGYTWFGVRGTTYLLDMEGRVAHTWPIGTNPHVLTNGNVLDASNNDPSGFSGFTEVDYHQDDHADRCRCPHQLILTHQSKQVIHE